MSREEELEQRLLFAERWLRITTAIAILSACISIALACVHIYTWTARSESSSSIVLEGDRGVTRITGGQIVLHNTVSDTRAELSTGSLRVSHGANKLSLTAFSIPGLSVHNPERGTLRISSDEILGTGPEERRQWLSVRASHMFLGGEPGQSPAFSVNVIDDFAATLSLRSRARSIHLTSDADGPFLTVGKQGDLRELSEELLRPSSE